MSIAELQIDLIDKIMHLRDKAKLTELLEWLNFDLETEPYQTSVEDRQAVAEAEQQILRGEVFNYDQVKAKTKKWIKP